MSNKNSDKPMGFQVINISNVNTYNEVMMNDETLLRFIQMYPFLYNPNIEPQNDPDYEAWAWERIAKNFNRTYENLDRNIWFTVPELIERWKVLKPLVKNMCKVSVIKSLPDSFREVIIKMNSPMEDERGAHAPKQTQLTPAQEVIMKYLPMVKRLSITHRRRLEAEVLEVILQNELSAKATLHLGVEDLATIQREYTDVMKTLGLTEFCPNNDEDRGSLDTDSETETSTTNDILPTNGHNIDMVTDNIKIDIDYEQIIVPYESSKHQITESNVTSLNAGIITEEDNLLEPLPCNKWVPLRDWRRYVRKCRVRIKRANLEDDVPLARIKKERKY